jgi:amino acid transporter
MSYITAELSTTFPQDGGYTVWVLNAFGPFWAFQTGFWSWVAYVVDNALYPSIAVATFKGVFGSIGSPTVEYLVKATITILLSLPNIFGLRIVGKAMIVLTLFVIAPFVVGLLYLTILLSG